MPDATLAIPAGATVAHRFTVRKAWAVPGSQYRIYAVVDYTHAGQHGSLVVPGGVSLAAVRRLSASTIHRLWWIPIGCLVMFAVRQVTAMRRTAARASV